jgi:hypothetical protein
MSVWKSMSLMSVIGGDGWLNSGLQSYLNGVDQTRKEKINDFDFRKPWLDFSPSIFIDEFLWMVLGR